jgi:CHAT domain
MIFKSQKGQELAKYLARPIVAQLAPDEIEDFDDLAEDFFDAPRLEGDRTLGSGLDLLPDLVVILMFVSTTLERLLAARGSESPKALLERLNKAIVHKQETEQTPWFSPEDLTAAFQNANQKTQRIPESTRREIERLLRKLLPVRVVILYLGANPTTEQRIGVDRELREIAAVLRESPLRDRISLSSVLSVTADELHRSLLANQPQILHFSGHGQKTSVVVEGPTGVSRDVKGGSILLEEPTGGPRNVQSGSLLKLLDLFKGSLRLVVLNTCHSEAQAREIAAIVDATIGMAGAISDTAALSFSRALYRALAHGTDLQQAFDSGCSQIELDAGAGIPRLFALRDDPRDIVLVEAAGGPVSA